jgi:hypothetical protein
MTIPCAHQTTRSRPRRLAWVKRARGLLALSLLALQGCLTSTWAEYPVKDSGRVANSDLKIYWLDNRSVLFQGHFLNADGSINGPNGTIKTSETLYEWDTDSRALKEHGDIGGGLCYANGYVRYWRRKEGESDGKIVDLIAGEIGKQTKIDPSLPDLPIDRETCKPRNDLPLPEWTQGKKVLRLKPEHGFLVLGPDKQDRNTQVTFHLKGAMEGITMPFKRREASLAFIKYAPFKQAYFIVGEYFLANPNHPDGGYNMSPWPKGTAIPAWWLYLDGRVEEIKLPTESRDGVWFFGMRNGIYYVSPRSPNANGLFKVLNDKKVDRILRGQIDAYAISSDGCRIAMNHDPNFTGKRGQGTVKAINVCAQGE